MKEKLRPAVVGIIVNSENKILIGSSPRDGGYKFPQGGLDEGETYLEGIKREVFEEIGVELNDEDIVEEFEEKISYAWPKHLQWSGFTGQEQVVFKIKFHERMEILAQDEEFDEFFWIDANELENYETEHRKEAYIRALELCGLRK